MVTCEYKIKLTEGEKSVKQEVEVIGDNREDTIKEVKAIFDELAPYCKLYTTKKAMER